MKTQRILSLVVIGGIPGGGWVVPVSIFFFKFDPKNSIALSNFSVFLSSFIRYLINYKNPHPIKKPGTGIMHDYNIAIIMLPIVVIGV